MTAILMGGVKSCIIAINLQQYRYRSTRLSSDIIFRLPADNTRPGVFGTNGSQSSPILGVNEIFDSRTSKLKLIAGLLDCCYYYQLRTVNTYMSKVWIAYENSPTLDEISKTYEAKF